MGQKLGAVPLLGGAGSPSNTMWPAPRPTTGAKFHLDPSNRLATIHQSQTDRQAGQSRQDRQRSNSIRGTVLQTIAHKPILTSNNNTDPSLVYFGVRTVRTNAHALVFVLVLVCFVCTTLHSTAIITNIYCCHSSSLPVFTNTTVHLFVYLLEIPRR